MPEYISREALKQALTDKFKSRIGASRVPTWNDAFDAVTNILSATDVVEVRHGRWEHLNWGFDYDRCSACGYEHRYSEDFNYCPNCGAKMDLPEPPEEVLSGTKE